MKYTDFDGTCANTFSSSPNGIDVHKAYSFAVRDVLGQEALASYISLGGLHNRTPVQVVRELLRIGDRKKFTETAMRYFEGNQTYVEELVPISMGIPINFDVDLEGSVTELLVRSKLSYLMNEVGGRLSNGVR